MDGPAFYREVQERFPEAAPRIVFMTAHQNVDEFVPFLKDVAAPVLQKPFSIEELRSTVARWPSQLAPEALQANALLGSADARGVKRGHWEYGRLLASHMQLWPVARLHRHRP